MANDGTTIQPAPPYVVTPNQASESIKNYDTTNDDVYYTGDAPGEQLAAVSAQVDFFDDGSIIPNHDAEDAYLARDHHGLFYDITSEGAGIPVNSSTTGGRVAETIGQDITFDSDRDGIMETYRGTKLGDKARYGRVAGVDSDNDGKIDSDWHILKPGESAISGQIEVVMTLAQLAAAEKKELDTYAELDGVVRYHFTEVRPTEVERDRSLPYDYQGDAIERTEAAMAAADMDASWAYLPLGELRVETQVTIPATRGIGAKPEHSDYRPDNTTISADEREYVQISEVIRSTDGFDKPEAEGAKPYEVRLPPAEEMRKVAIERLTQSQDNGNPYGIPNGTSDANLTQYIPGDRSVEEWYADSIAYHAAREVGELLDIEARDYVAKLQGNPNMVMQRAAKDSTDYRNHLLGKPGEVSTPTTTPGAEAPKASGGVPEDPYKGSRGLNVQDELLRGLGLLGEEDKAGEGRKKAEERYAELIGPGGALEDKSPEEILALARVLEEGGPEAHAAKTWLLGPEDLAHSLPSFVREANRKDTDPKDRDNPDAVSGSMAGRDDKAGDAAILDDYLRTTYQPRINDANKKLAQAEDWLERQGKGEIVPPPDGEKVAQVQQERDRLRGELDSIYLTARGEAKKVADALRYGVDENGENVDDAYLQQWGLSGFSAEEEEKARLARREDGVGDGKFHKRFKEARETIGDIFDKVLGPAADVFSKGASAWSSISQATTGAFTAAAQADDFKNKQNQAFMQQAVYGRRGRGATSVEEFAQQTGALRPDSSAQANAAAAREAMARQVAKLTGETTQTGPNAGKTPEQVEQERKAATEQYLAQLNQREQEERQKERRESGGSGSGGSFGLA